MLGPGCGLSGIMLCKYAGFVWDYPGRAWEVRCLAVMSTIRVFFSDGLKMSWSFFRVVNAIQSAVQAVRQTGAGKRAAFAHGGRLGG